MARSSYGYIHYNVMSVVRAFSVRNRNTLQL